MEIPERYLEQARDNKLEDLIHDMKMGENSEWLWAEIERILASKDTADIDSIEDMTLADLIARVCEAKADKMMDDGDLDEEATDIAVGAAEDRSDYFQDR
jgi:hypothetical protein